MQTEFKTLDSGKRVDFPTGARRDVEEGKGRFDLIPFYPLQRLAQLYQRGAEKYGDRNWQKGIPLSRFLSSAYRHLGQLGEGMEDEDHAAAVLFNVMGFMWTQREIDEGRLPDSLEEGMPQRTPAQIAARVLGLPQEWDGRNNG